MSASLCIRLENEVNGLATAAPLDGRALARALPRLDRIAKRLGVRPLTAFVAADEDEDEDDDFAELDEFFAAAPGLRAVRALIRHVGSNPRDVPRSVDVMRDLKSIEAVLKLAGTQDVRFCLGVEV